MPKYILGAVIGAGLVLASVAFAQGGSGLSVVDQMGMIQNYNVLTKVYDKDANVVCYEFIGYDAGGISCLKNN